ncbi:pyridoxamine 5'-phosphate oxidase family protein [Nocardiopsis sp. CC223A]|uniref:pyridoxamine 5'-phosphate oxidase family protein n=1 Tax=Nocardiopsis sp. CC223A TaxID=3044051 RepID=UPI00278C1619|nr:pyridoxamine 5'-phosphate oxidase family protein [Nocardiopsis sp. CC223A]
MNADRTGPGHDAEVSDAVARRLATEHGVWLATARSGGAPHVTPVWFVFDRPKATWWISTGAGSVKVRNIAQRPEVSLALEDGRSPVVAEGTALIHREGFPATVIEAFARKYDGWDITVPHSPGDVRVLVEVTTRRWLLRGG